MAQYDDVAADYARLIAPRYAPIARLVADGVLARSPAREATVVEVAAGTGLLTSLLAPELPAGTRYVATDLALPMLRLAREQLGDTGVRFALAGAHALPFRDRCADLVVSSLGPVQEDVALLAEARRVLAPGGHLVLGLWGTGYSELALLQVARTRLGLGDFPAAPVEAATARCVDAGFEHVHARPHRLDVTHPGMAAYLAYRRSFGWPPWLPEGRREDWLPAVESAAAAYVDDSGQVRLDWTVVVVEARRPV
jgi:SAM-dependent methyltransferase